MTVAHMVFGPSKRRVLPQTEFDPVTFMTLKLKFVEKVVEGKLTWPNNDVKSKILEISIFI